MKKLFAFFTFIFLALAGNSQTTNAFRVNYDQALFDLPGNAVEALTTSNYVFAGTNLNFLPIYGTVTQIDDVGALVWSKRYYDGSLGFQLNDIKKDISLNEYYLCGGSESNAAVFMRIDATGNVVASTKFSISQADGAYFNRIIKASDGGYVAVGYVIGHDPDGAGGEIDFVSQNCTDSDGDSHTEYFGSPLIVKLDNNGNHIWHKVFRYYDNPAKAVVDRIYNDASFVDVVEVSDGYIAVGSYDVNDWNPNVSNDCNDQSPTDAIVLKTTTAGAITFHKQFDAINFSGSQNSKYFGAINKTSTGLPIAVGYDNGREWITKYPGSGAWALTFSRLFTYSTFFGTPDPVDNSQIYEVTGGTDLVTMGMYIKPLSFVFSNSLHRMSANAQTNVWAKYYTFGLGAFLPRGSQVSDNGFIMSSMSTGVNWDYHIIKTDPNGDTPLAGCAPTTFTPSASAGTTTTADPYYNFWSGTVGPQALAISVSNVSPTANVQCSFTTCTAPSITTQPSNITVCATGSNTLSVAATSGPYQWQYNNGGSWQNVTNGSPSGITYANGTSNTLTINTSGAAAGTYQYQVIVGNPGCETISNTVTVTVPGATQLAPLGSVCSGTTLNFTSSPASGATYAWSVTPPSGTSATPTSGSSQNFSYTPTNTTGSNQVFNVSVNITSNGTTCPVNFTNTVFPTPSAPIIGTITQPTCSTPTGSVQLTGLPATGSWTVTASPGGATQTGSGTSTTFAGLSPGSYTFTVQNASGCTSSASGSAVLASPPAIPSAPIVGAITQPDCATATGSVSLSGLPAGSWTITASPGGATLSGTGSTASFTGLSANSYTFTVTNASGCTSSASTSAVVNSQPTTPTAPIVGAITQPDCATSTGSVSLSGLPSSGTWTVTINPGGATQTGSGTTASITGLTANTYTFTVTNAQGCTSTASSNAVVNSQPTTPSAPIVGTVIQPNCTVTTGSVTLNGLPGSGSWTVTVNPGGSTQSGSGTSTTINGLSPNNYTFTVTNAQGCTSSASASQTIDPVPGAPTAPTATVTQPDCTTPTGTLQVNTPLGGNYTYSIDGTNFQSSPTFNGLSPNNYSVTVLDNTTGCSSTSASTYTVDPVSGAPTINLDSQVNVTCAGGSDGAINLTISGGQAPYNFAWTPNVGNTDDVSGLSAGTYSVIVTDNLGCSSTDTWTIIEPSAIVGNDLTSPVDCNSGSLGSIALSPSGGTGPFTYSWTPNSETTSSISGLTPGNYSVTITDNVGCSVVENFTISTTGSLGVDASPEITTILQGESVQLSATGATNYTWTPIEGLSCVNCPNPIASPDITTSYIVIGTDAQGCSGADTILIIVEENCSELFVPNIFSPNGNGPAANETLCVFGDCIETLLFRVFDRWGELVFETETAFNPSNGSKNEICWDGTFRGKEAQGGSYVYTLHAKKTNGDMVDTSGNITLVR